MVSLLGPSFVTGEGLHIPLYENVSSNLKLLEEFKPQDHDYILCSYPKSGTHWVNEIISMLITGETVYSSAPINNLESGCFPPTDSKLSRVIHTHLPYDMLPASIHNKKIVYVLRNPRDQMVSLYHHHQGLRWTPSLTFQQFFTEVIEHPENVGYGDWFRNAYQWWCRCQNNKNILVLYYEKLITDLPAQIERIVQFYNLKISPEFLNTVSQKTQFIQMKNNKPTGDWFFNWHKESFSIFRSGEVGSWHKYFTKEMNRQFQIYCESRLQGCSIPPPYLLYAHQGQPNAATQLHMTFNEEHNNIIESMGNTYTVVEPERVH